MRKIVTLASVLSGVSLLAAAAWAHSRPADPVTPTWSYLCFEGDGPAEVMKKANQAGAHGWKMVAASPTKSGATWCFEQPRWARPLPGE